MKKLIDYKEEIHKCSKCGLCQSVCPVYEVTGNDCCVSRGKFIMLNGIVKGDLELNKNVNKYLDMCLKCNACKDFCPSAIDARRIFLTAKSQYFAKCPTSFFVKGFQSKFVFNSVLNLVKVATDTYRFFKFDKIAATFYPILQKFEIGKKIILANEFVAKTTKKTKKSEIQTTSKAVYFKGCVNEFINPKVKNATESVLAKMGVEVLPLNFECCGVPFLSSGNEEQFVKQAIYNLSQVPDEFDSFLTDCASCQNAFLEYKNYITDANLLKKIDKILEKSMNVSEFILKNIKSVEFDKKTSITFHKPCHLENTDFINDFLKKVQNVEYVEMEEFDKCCGFAGAFAINNPEISAKISAKKAKNALNTKADYVLTSCPVCVLGLTQGMVENNDFAPVLNFVEFLSRSDRIC